MSDKLQFVAVFNSAISQRQTEVCRTPSLSRSLIRRSANDKLKFVGTPLQSTLRSTAQRQQYRYFIFRSQSRRQFSRLVVIDEYLYVRANGILFVYDAKSKSR